MVTIALLDDNLPCNSDLSCCAFIPSNALNIFSIEFCDSSIDRLRGRVFIISLNQSP